MNVDRNDAYWWYPRLLAGGVPMPRTEVVRTEVDLTHLLDGIEPEGFNSFLSELCRAVSEIGTPCFLRTGHGSGKHEWLDTCYIPAAAGRQLIEQHLFNLVEWSHMADIMGLPTNTWLVRELLDVLPLFRCEAYRNMPVLTEWRTFVRGGDFPSLYGLQPYWPPGALSQGEPDDPLWRHKYISFNLYDLDRRFDDIFKLAWKAGQVLGEGDWSVDIVAGFDGELYVIDVAEAERSYRYDVASEWQVDIKVQGKSIANITREEKS